MNIINPLANLSYEMKKILDEFIIIIINFSFDNIN